MRGLDRAAPRLVAQPRRSRAGSRAFGCLLLLFGFFVGNRGPVRLKGEAQPFFGPRFLRWATPEEHSSTIAESAIFIVVGLIIILIGLVVDNRYQLHLS